MEETKNQQPEVAQPTYDEVVAKNTELTNQMRFMVKKLQEAQEFLALRRLDYIFKVLENKNVFSQEVIARCAEEISETLYPTAEESNQE